MIGAKINQAIMNRTAIEKGKEDKEMNKGIEDQKESKMNKEANGKGKEDKGINIGREGQKERKMTKDTNEGMKEVIKIKIIKKKLADKTKKSTRRSKRPSLEM